ncbi:hypothetical protein GWA97_01760 [Flavobacterium sp. LaA7.5]|nr:hypothetical protein [Flavobacterium salilacus subsp. altitudinum]
MIVYKVTYTMPDDFISQNQENIRAFMNDFKRIDASLFQYNVYQSSNRKTFIHLSHFNDEKIQKAVLSVSSFVSFQEKRDAGGLESAPLIEVLHFMESSKDIIS